ncbi:MAG: sugar phosphate nucleotidyltransferase, partial [Chlamydiales bacterium]
MKVVILAGGLGSRISEKTHDRPKPMVEIGEMPLLWHLMNIYSAYGFNEFIIALGYKGDVIKEYFLNFYRLNSDISVDLQNGEIRVQKRVSHEWKIDLVDTG